MEENEINVKLKVADGFKTGRVVLWAGAEYEVKVDE